MQALIDQFLSELNVAGLARNSLLAYRGDLEALAAFCRRRRVWVETLTHQHVCRFLKANSTWGATTVYRRLMAIRQFLRWAGRDDLAARIHTPKRPRRLPHALNAKSAGSIVEAPGPSDRLSPRDRAALELLYGCGLRVSELVGLRLGDLFLSRGCIRVRGKGGHERVVPIGRPAREALEVYLQRFRSRLAGGSDRVFLSQHRLPMHRGTAWRMVQKYAGRIGVDTGPHGLRHAYATALVRGGADLRVVQELLGHRSINTTEVYVSVDASRLKAVHTACFPRP